MSGTPTPLVGTLVGDTAAPLHTVAASKAFVLKQVFLVNQDVAQRQISLHNVAPAGAAAEANAFLWDVVLEPGQNATLPMTMTLEAGAKLMARASVAGVVSLSASGITYDDTDKPLPIVLFRGMLDTVLNPVYTSPPGKTTVLKGVTLCNTTTMERKASLYVVPAAGAISEAHMVFKERPIPASSTAFESMTNVLAPGDKLYVVANTATTVAAIASGVAA